MSAKKIFSRIPLVRPAALRILRAFARDTSIRNPWTGDELKLNTFIHKGYWFFGKAREEQTMLRFKEIIRPGNTVIEIGGHIGFITQYFAKLVGFDGKVIVFEPGSNNLPYIEANTSRLRHVKLERMAVSSKVGEAEFFEDNITGQNNSLLTQYKGADGVGKTHGMELVRTKRRVVLTTLADYMLGANLKVDLVKIDIEGHELAALQGAEPVLKLIRWFMVEVTEDQEAVGGFLQEHGFRLLTPEGVLLTRIDSSFSGNLFAAGPDVSI